MLEASALNATADHHTYLHYGQLLGVNGFLDAVDEGDSAAGE